MSKTKIIYMIVSVIISVGVVGCSWEGLIKKNTESNKEEKTISQKQEEKPLLPNPKSSPCFTFVTPVPNSSVKAFPIPVEVVVDNSGDKGCAWTTFEGSAGTMKLTDRFNKVIATGKLTTEENWMTEGPVTFKGVIGDELVVHDQILRLTITEENPRGEGESDEVIIKLYY